MINEQPAYVLHQKLSRALTFKIIILIILGTIFYLGILLNLKLLELRANHETIIKLSALGLVSTIIILAIILSLHRARLPYLFYRTNLMFSNKTINYTEISNTIPKKDSLDKIFKTYNIDLGNNFVIKHIPNEINMEQYLKQLIEFSKKISLQKQY